MATLEERVDVLENIEAIRRLKIEYAQACDDGYDQDRIAECYTEDGVFDTGEFGRHEGRETIRELFTGQEDVFQFALHNVLGHTVYVEPFADTATGSVYLFQPCTVEGEARWFAATYDEEYRKEDGKWRFSLSKLNVAFNTPYDKGWVEQRMA